ncbi:MAG: hypothetical protein AB1586_24960 [Pseudomonadota bacterium]
MTALFETDGVTTKRMSTGSKITLNTTPPELSDGTTFLYESPRYRLKVRFPAIFVFETFVIAQLNGTDIDQPVTAAVILRKGQLASIVEHQLGASLSQPIVDEVLGDIYSLILEEIRRSLVRFQKLEVSKVGPHIYEAETRLFNEAMWNSPDDVYLGPETMSRLKATLIV